MCAFFQEMSGTATGQPASWKTLTSYLTNIKNKGKENSSTHLNQIMQYLQRLCFCSQMTLFQLHLGFHWTISWMGWISQGIIVTLAPWPPLLAMRPWFGMCSKSRSKSAKTWWVSGGPQVQWPVQQAHILHLWLMQLTRSMSCFQIDLFSTTIHINNSSSPLMTNVFRKIQPDQPVTESAGISSREDWLCQ